MRVAVGGDHAGFSLKPALVAAIRSWGHDVADIGSCDPAPVDFPDIARQVAAAIRERRADRGILVCGTGVGACIAANKISGIRAAVCHDAYSAHQAVEHDDVNLLCLGAQIVGPWLALDLVRTYLLATFEDAEPYRRLAKLADLEREMGIY